MATTTEDIYNLIADVTHNSLLERHLIEYQIDDVIDDLLDDELYTTIDEALEVLYNTISTESSVRPNLDQQQLFKTVFPTASANLEIAVTKIKERNSMTVPTQSRTEDRIHTSWAYQEHCRCQDCQQYRRRLKRRQKEACKAISTPPCGDLKKHNIAIEWGNNCTECNDAFVESLK